MKITHISGADDIAAQSDGTLWVSEPAAGMVTHISSAGEVLARVVDPETPEGVVALDDGRLLVAEQTSDRIVVLHPPSPERATLIQLTPRPGVDGVDGLGFDPENRLVLVPDSAQGRLLSIAVDGGRPSVVASDLGRAVGAAVSPEGDLAVAVEAASGLVLVNRNSGAATAVTGISQADDVVAAGPLLYVSSLEAHEILAVDPGSRRFQVLVTDVDMPQGLASLPGDRLAVIDSTTGSVALVPAC